MNELTKKLSHVLELGLAKNYTSVSYAFMVGGKLIAADALGTNGNKDNTPSTINDTYNICSVSRSTALSLL